MFIFLAVLFSNNAFAQSSIQGKIIDAATKQALMGATIEWVGTHLVKVSDANGWFEFSNLKQDHIVLHVRYMGYKPLSIQLQNSEKVKEIFLERDIIQTSEIAIVANRFSSNNVVAQHVIKHDEIESNDYGKDVPYLLEQTPSVVSSSDGGTGVGYTSIRMRGSDASRINVTINGVPLNDAESQLVYWVDLPDFLSSTDNIQIQRGLGTSSNGAGAFGGSINLETNKIKLEPFVNTTIGYGSFNTQKYNLSFGSGLIKSKFLVDARASMILSDGYVDRSSSDLKSAMVNATYFLKKGSIKASVFSGHEITYQAWNGIPEYLLSSNPTFNSFTYKNQVDNYLQNHYHLAYSYMPDNGFSLNVTGHFTKGKGFYEEYKTNQSLSDYSIDEIILSGDTIRSSDLIRRKWLDNDFGGIVFSINDSRSERWKYSLGGGANSYFGKHFGEVIWARYASNSETEHVYYKNDALKTDINLYSKIEYRLSKKVGLFADMQYRTLQYRYDIPDAYNKLSKKSDQLHFLNPKIGFWYSWNDSWRSSVFAGMGNKEPNRSDYVDVAPGFVPVHESLLDFEWMTSLTKSTFKIELNMFHMLYKNQLVLNGKINDVGNYIRENIEDSYRQGFELALDYRLHKKVSSSVNVTWMNSSVKSFAAYVDDYDNGGQLVENYSKTRIAFTPDLISNLNLTYNPIKDFDVVATFKYVGKQYLDNTENNSRVLDAYQYVNVSMRYKMKNKSEEEISLGLTVYNFLDESYVSNGYTFSYIYDQSYTTENYYFPQAGRHFMIQLKAKI
ncbi:MAG TPA: carboxypeptidase-like regulatory domain-containing protein [Bacteroidia bacterium]|nr:carboxypeptidase-like regulatory domain-containing protein [Bacteroidia bacterium]